MVAGNEGVSITVSIDYACGYTNNTKQHKRKTRK